SAPGCAPCTLRVRLDASPSPVELQLGRPEVVEGRLTDPQGRPLAGIRVRVAQVGGVVRQPAQGAEEAGDRGGWPAPAVTGASGDYSFVGLNRSSGLWAQADDPRLAPYAWRLPPAGPNPVTTIQPGRVIAGRVVAEGTGLPVAGARVTTRRPGG